MKWDWALLMILGVVDPANDTGPVLHGISVELFRPFLPSSHLPIR
jgi:hypothetical protein